MELILVVVLMGWLSLLMGRLDNIKRAELTAIEPMFNFKRQYVKPEDDVECILDYIFSNKRAGQ